MQEKMEELNSIIQVLTNENNALKIEEAKIRERLTAADGARARAEEIASVLLAKPPVVVKEMVPTPSVQQPKPQPIPEPPEYVMQVKGVDETGRIRSVSITPVRKKP